MKKKFAFGILCFMLLCFCACESRNEEEMWDVTRYERIEDIKSIEKMDLGQTLSGGIEISTYKLKYQVDENIIVSYLSIPNTCLEERKACPCIIYNRGGNREFGANTPENIAYLAEASGKVIFATQYRGVDGGTGTEEFGGADLNDVLKLIDFCEEFAFVDMDQLYMVGISRGGMMTYMAVREDRRIKKAVVISGLSDAFMAYEERTDMQDVFKDLVKETPESNPKEYEKRSAVYWAEEIECPILIIHSKLDESVSFEQAKKMVEALEEAGKTYQLVSYEDDIHGLHQEDVSIIMEWCQ